MAFADKKYMQEEKDFIQKITDYIDMLYKKNPPQPPDDCGCRMHKFFYNEERLKELQ